MKEKLIQWGGILHKMPSAAQPIENFPALYGTEGSLLHSQELK
jgi:hypothetical protein